MDHEVLYKISSKGRTFVPDTFQVWPESVRKVWRLVCSEGNVTPRPRNYMSVSPPPKQLFWELYSVIYSRGFIIHIKLDHKMTDISSR